MKKRILSIIAALTLVFSAGSVIAQFGSIKGSVLYLNENQILITDSAIVTLSLNGIVLQTCPVSPAGLYQFYGLVADTYDLKVTCTKYWGGANAVDALLILKHFVNLPACLFGISALAGDVDGSGGIVNAADALAIIRRFTGQLSSFLPPNVNPPGNVDWVSERPEVIVQAFSVSYKDINILCTGDVNGSFIPF